MIKLNKTREKIMDVFKVGSMIAITEICDTHNKKCTKHYNIINVDNKGRRFKLDEIDDDTSECVFMGTHYCSSMTEPMDYPYLTLDNGKYGLESEDYETALLNLDDVKLL